MKEPFTNMGKIRGRTNYGWFYFEYVNFQMPI